MTDRAEIGGIAETSIRKYPTRLNLRCGACGHQGSAVLFLSETRRLRCSKCSSRNVVVLDRDRLRAWSRRRRGR